MYSYWASVQVFIFRGDFLDARSTIVFAIFFFVGTYFLGSIRAVAPKLYVSRSFPVRVRVTEHRYVSEL